MFKSKVKITVGLLSITASILVIGLFIKTSFADDLSSGKEIQVSSFSQQQPVTTEEEQKINEKVEAIYTKFGEFRRSANISTVNEKGNNSEEVVYDLYEVTAKTKVIITNGREYIKQ
ncbi:hypothetical protein [Paenibacillus sp. NPDC093718]|uniref:hypothetical protein n=1 Tax=Paenibacillus sp. NPDC093718 TaxID=3390601 RepID=UPI003D08AF36